MYQTSFLEVSAQHTGKHTVIIMRFVCQSSGRNFKQNMMHHWNSILTCSSTKGVIIGMPLSVCGWCGREWLKKHLLQTTEKEWEDGTLFSFIWWAVSVQCHNRWWDVGRTMQAPAINAHFRVEIWVFNYFPGCADSWTFIYKIGASHPLYHALWELCWQMNAVHVDS